MKTTEEMIAVMQAYADGKEIELLNSTGKWRTVSAPSWNWEEANKPMWNWVDFDYRIKKQPKEPEYVPFTFEDADFLIGKTVRCKSQDYVALIISVTKDGTSVDDFKPLLDDFTFLDGSPCGKLKQQ